MAALDDLISQIPDESLRERIRAEMKRANRQKKFGLVFEEHLPEATPLYDIPVKRGSVVAKKDGQVTDIYYIERIEDGQATCFHKASKEHVVLPVDALVCVAQFGEPIYPYLQPLDTVCNAPDSDLWHTLIEADNYHALQLWSTSMPERWIVSTSTHPITQGLVTGNTITTTWMATIPTVTASGFP